MNISALISADHFFLTTLFTSHEETCYYLEGVFVEPSPEGGALLTATDGHALACLRDTQGFAKGERIVKLPCVVHDIWNSMETFRQKHSWIALVCPDDQTTGRCEARLFCEFPNRGSDIIRILDLIQDITSSGIIWSGGVELINGKFPDWRRVVPKKMPTAAPVPFVQQRFIASFLKVSRALSQGSVKLIFNDQDKAAPAFVDVGHVDFFGLLMPLQNVPSMLPQHEGYYNAPNWLGLPE